MQRDRIGRAIIEEDFHQPKLGSFSRFRIRARLQPCRLMGQGQWPLGAAPNLLANFSYATVAGCGQTLFALDFGWRSGLPLR
jgi:hypothetical protein